MTHFPEFSFSIVNSCASVCSLLESSAVRQLLDIYFPSIITMNILEITNKTTMLSNVA